MIDSSPMYGMAQATIGQALDQLDNDQALFSATKVWTPGAAVGRFQIENALKSWRLDRFDLLHVHNMVDWDDHLPWMQAWQQEGRLRYTGITTSHGRRHRALADVIRSQPFEVVQFTYNIAHREAESELLPLSLEHGKAVVINRPFDGGRLFRAVEGRDLPAIGDLLPPAADLEDEQAGGASDGEGPADTDGTAGPEGSDGDAS